MGILLDRLSVVSKQDNAHIVFKHVDKSDSVNSVFDRFDHPTIFALIEYFDHCTGEYLGSRVDECEIYHKYRDRRYGKRLIQEFFDLRPESKWVDYNFDPHLKFGIARWPRPHMSNFSRIAYVLKPCAKHGITTNDRYGFRCDWVQIDKAIVTITEVVVANIP